MPSSSSVPKASDSASAQSTVPASNDVLRDWICFTSFGWMMNPSGVAVRASTTVSSRSIGAAVSTEGRSSRAHSSTPGRRQRLRRRRFRGPRVSENAPSRRAWKSARAASASSTVMSPRLMSASV